MHIYATEVLQRPAQLPPVAQPAQPERNGSFEKTDPFLKEVQSFMDRLRLISIQNS